MKVNVVIGVYGGVLDECFVLTDATTAERVKDRIEKDYGIDKTVDPAEQEHQVSLWEVEVDEV